MQRIRHVTYALSLIAAFFSSAGFAQTASPTPSIAVELNAADLVGEACRITFVVTNKSPEVIDKAIYETVLFSKDGDVMMLTLFDFGVLPVAVPRVRQFQVSDTACDRIGMVLINGANTCSVEKQDTDICASGLTTSSRLDIELQG